MRGHVLAQPAINPVSGGVEPQVVNAEPAREAGEDRARLAVHHGKLPWLKGGGEQAVIGFIDGHGVRVAVARDFPLGHGAGLLIDDVDGFLIGKTDQNNGTILLQLK